MGGVTCDHGIRGSGSHLGRRLGSRLRSRLGSRQGTRVSTRLGSRAGMHLRHGLVALTAAALAVLGLTAVVTPTQAADAGFVTRCGIRFCLDGKVWYFAGANTYDVFTYGGSWGETETTYMDKARIDAHFAQLASDKVSVLRLWMFSHEDWHGFEPTEGVYNDQEFALFDYVIEAAKKNGIRLIPVFENYWEAYGGIDTRLKWEGLAGGQANRWRFFNKTACPGCFTQYKNYVSYALNRVNHYSGVAYKDEPTIMAWELMNEPRYEKTGTDEDSTGKTLRAWVDEMGAYIKSIDSHHLLGAGLEGHQAKYGFGGDEGNPFVYIQQSPAIDFTSAHPYPDEGWAGLDIAKTKTLIRAWISDSHDVVGKPFFMGEWNVHQNWTEWWTAIYADFEAAGGDGSAFWWYMDRSGGGGFDTGAGAPQLAVFRAHSAAMAAKSGARPSTTTTSPTTTTTSTTTTTKSTTTTTTSTSTKSTTTTSTSTKPTSTKPTTTKSGGKVKTTKKCKTGKNGKKTCKTITKTVKKAKAALVAAPTGCRVTADDVQAWPGGYVARLTVTGTTSTAGAPVEVRLPGGVSVLGASGGRLQVLGSGTVAGLGGITCA